MGAVAVKNKSWHISAEKLHFVDGLSCRETAKQLGMPRATVTDYLRKIKNKFMNDYNECSNLRAFTTNLLEPRTVEFTCQAQPAIPWPFGKPETEQDNSRILFISDTHIPYHNPDLIPFLKGLKQKYNPTRIIHLGDEVDHHATSFHDSDPDLDSAGSELKKALPVIKQLEELFPVMDLIDSNHGSMIYRKAKHHGIPRSYIRPYNEVLEVGLGWKWHHDLLLTLPNGQEVYVHHGKNADAIKVSQMMGMSHVCGHYHESFAIKYWSTPRGLYWGVNAGCLIDRKSLAFAYNNVNLKRPVIGTALIIDGVPVLEAMPL
jgi:hypothetical protein